MRTHAVLDRVIQQFKERPRNWLVTGAAGFIGSHVVEDLLLLNQKVVGIDNFSNGSRFNLEEIQASVGPRWANFSFIEGDISDFDLCQAACRKVEIVLHHAALGSVPRSIANPRATNQSNVTGFLNVLTAAKEAGIKRFVYASSSSVYGDNADLPKTEDRIGKPLSPYAVTKVANELYARTFSDLFGMETIGLRYFNVFGSRQPPNGPYAAVIPKWVQAIVTGSPVQIYGDGTTSRDFCYVKNVVQMNLLAAGSTQSGALNRVFNTACNQRTTLNALFGYLREAITARIPGTPPVNVEFVPARRGDIHHSQAEITDAIHHLGYQPLYDVVSGLEETLPWYIQNLTP